MNRTDDVYLLRGIPRDLWARAQKRAEADQIDLRTAILTMLDYYADTGVDVTPRVRKRIPAGPTPRSAAPPFAAV